MKHPYTAFSLVLGVLVLSSCARSPRPTPASVSPNGDCRLDRPSSDRSSVPAEARTDGRSDRAAGAVDVALLEPFDPSHAPVPRTSSESLVFGHFYETLVRVDCGGEVRPGLAVAWREEEDGRRWLFTLREDATFWDGAPVTPRDVIASWAAAARTGADEGAYSPAFGHVPRPRRFTVKGDGSFEVVFSPPHPASPAAFAHPAAAVRGTGSGGAWPPGSGPYRPVLAGERAGEDAPEAPGRAGEGDVLALRTGGASQGPSLRFRPAAGRDARDLLEADVDLVVSRDPEVLSYAEAHPAFVTVPLPWDRLYLFVPPVPVGAAAGARSTERRVDPDPDSAVAALRRSLARDVARSEARPSRQPAGRKPGLPGSGRVLYSRDDADARALAERLVALATSPEIPGRAVPAVVAELGSEPRPPRAVGVGARQLAEALDRRRSSPRARSGPPADAMVVAIPAWRLPESRRATEPTGELSGALPLIETRARLIVRRGISFVAVDGSGTPILSGVRP